MNTTPATNDATRDTTDASLSRHGVAARLFRVSLRTVQRRLDRGELRFIERDGKRFVLLEGDAIARDSDATARQTVVSRDTTSTTRGALSSERESELKEEVRFLRGLVEQRDRDAAELRAALREALKAQPKQLLQSTPESAIAAQQRLQTGEASSDSQQPSRRAGIEADGAGADELDAGELLELCRRISR